MHFSEDLNYREYIKSIAADNYSAARVALETCLRIRIKKATYSCGKSSTHSHFKKASYSYAKEPFINATNTAVLPWLEISSEILAQQNHRESYLRHIGEQSNSLSMF